MRRIAVAPAGAPDRPMAGRPRRLWVDSCRRLLLIALLCALTAGCVTIPSSSSVHEGRQLSVQDDPQQFTYDPPGPYQGAGRRDVVQGFFTAMLAYPQTYAKARMFLTPRAATRWDPSAGLDVYEDKTVVEADKTVSVLAHKLGSLDSRGSWTSPRSSSETLRLDLHLVQIRGQWRISDPPKGTYIDGEYFERRYSQYSLYFLDPAREILVPDPVYVLSSETVATSLVRNLLLGPTNDLAGVVESAAPPGVELDVATAVGNNGRARVPLTPGMLDTSAQDRQLFAAQLTWTLKQVPEIRDFMITVDGTVVQIPNQGPVVRIDDFPGYNPVGLGGERRLFALGPDGLVTVSAGGTSPVLGPVRSLVDLRSVAVDIVGSLAAGVTADGSSVVVANIPNTPDSGVTTWLRNRTDLLRPSWDYQQVVWVVDQTAAGCRLLTVTPDGARAVSLPELGRWRIVSFAVSRDGVRLAAVIHAGGRSKIVIWPIVRDPQSPGEVTLGRPQPLVSSQIQLTHITQLSWASPTTVVVLAEEKGRLRAPYEVAIDGSSTAAVGGLLPVRPLSIVSGPTPDSPVAVGASGGRVYVQTLDQQWVKWGGNNRVSAPVYPG